MKKKRNSARSAMIILIVSCLLACQTVGENGESGSDGTFWNTLGLATIGVVLVAGLVALEGSSDRDKCEKYHDRYRDCLKERGRGSCRDERVKYERYCS